MLTIQEVGKEILSNNPRKFYVFLGEEYGIKERYIDIVAKHYGEVIEAESVDSVLQMMRVRHIIPLKPALYICRYDEDFVTNLSDKVQYAIQKSKIVGTIICIYEQSKHAQKLSKILPDFCVDIPPVHDNFVMKYLKQEFDIPDKFVQAAAKYATNYGHAKNICRALQHASDVRALHSQKVSDIAALFGCHTASGEKEVRIGIAARDFPYLMKMLETYQESLDGLFYTILGTLVELDKLLDKPYTDSDIKEYAKRWTREDVYYMFMHTYGELKKSRSISYNIENGLLYLFALLMYKSIPSLEVLS